MVDKPAGTAVHGGSGVSFGVIESLRAARPQAKFLELVHRLDRETSGLLIVAKKRSALVALHDAFRERHAREALPRAGEGPLEGAAGAKSPWACANTSPRRASGAWPSTVPAASRARRSRWCERSATTACCRPASRPAARTRSACTSRISAIPIVGDDKYGDFELNRAVSRRRAAAHVPARLRPRFRPSRDRRAGPAQCAAAARTGAVRRPPGEAQHPCPGSLISSSSTGTAPSSTRRARSSRACRRRAPTSGSPCRITRTASHVIGLGLHDALSMVAPDLAVARLSAHGRALPFSFPGARHRAAALSRHARNARRTARRGSHAGHRHRQEPRGPRRARSRQPGSRMSSPPRAAPTSARRSPRPTCCSN